MVSVPEQPPASFCCSSTLARLLSPRLFRALADPTRLSLLVRLAEGQQPRTVSQVAEGCRVDLSVVSRHLAVLREAGIITCTRQGKEVLCTVQTSVVARVLRELADALEACCPAGVSQEHNPHSGAQVTPESPSASASLP